MLCRFSRYLLTGCALGLLLAMHASGAQAQPCVGDCNQDGRVSLGETQTALDIFFDDGLLDRCPPADANDNGEVSLGEIQTSLDNFFNDCPGAPTRTPTPTSRPTDTATNTPTRTWTPTRTATATATAPLKTPTPDSILFSGTIVELIPHGLGDILEYRVTRSTGETRETREVTRVGREGQSTTFSVEVIENRDETIEDFADSGSELTQRRLEEKEQNDVCTSCSPELLQIRTPLIAGETSVSNSICTVRLCRSGTFLGTFPQQNEITPIEQLDRFTVPAGTYDGVIRIKAISKILNGQEINDVYVVPGIGVIRRDFEFEGSEILRELAGGTIGGVPVGQ